MVYFFLNFAAPFLFFNSFQSAISAFDKCNRNFFKSSSSLYDKLTPEGSLDTSEPTLKVTIAPCERPIQLV